MNDLRNVELFCQGTFIAALDMDRVDYAKRRLRGLFKSLEKPVFEDVMKRALEKARQSCKKDQA